MASTKQYSHFLETLRGVKSIKLFQRENERQAAWLSLLGEQVNADIRMQKSQIFYKLLNGILFGMENILIIYIGASQVIGGEFSVGMLMAFNSYKGQFDSRISSLIDKYFELRLLEVQGERLSDIIFSSREKMDGEQSINFSEPIGIEFSNVSYRYSNSEPFVLDGLNFAIKAGESVAITGPSGCGKTTIVNLMLKIFDPVRGDIFFDDKPYNRIGAGGVRSVIGTVLQDDVLFAGSIFDNICFFDPDADRTWVKQCAQMADINEDIESMPMGYNTLVGDMGTTLSGGQKQRVLLARALYKKPKILILDEATSHLDVERENHVNKAIQRLSVTRIIVAHRPETIASADRVLIMGAGRIEKDIGRHGEKYA
jgi:ATP-binding cassette subfamily B protein RaxB